MILDTSAILDGVVELEGKRGGISVITLLEIVRGVKKDQRERTKQLLEESHPVYQIDNDVILTYSEIYNELRETGAIIPDADILIASTAISKNQALKTKDTHFARLEQFGLRLV